MIIRLSDHIISPLGEGTLPNYQAVIAGRSALRLHTDMFASVEPFMASLFPERPHFTDLCIRSAQAAVRDAGIDAAAPDVVLILSTTKGDNLDLLTPAHTIAQALGCVNPPVVVSNACTSGVCAQITAQRLLMTKQYRTAIVIGCDVQTRFIVSGFQSFKALSQDECRPFDAARKGLNLGEAAATIILRYTEQPPANSWVLEADSIHNDANHISGPSRTAEGSLRCLLDVKGNADDLAFVSVHGTGTLYNDDMESVAIQRAGLGSISVTGLKGYYGHTMGAAGVLETLLGMQAVEHNTIVGVRGFSTPGTKEAVNISALHRPTAKHSFIKLLSGFGGVNAAVRWTRQ